MDKIAIISDIHGNLEALKQVLSDIKKRNIDKIICLGDVIAKGSHPNECVDLIRENCFVVISGNNDRHFTSEHDLESLSEIEQKRINWNKGLLSDENKNYLKSLPFCHEFYMSGSLVRVFHASPRNDVEIVANFDTAALKSTMFEPSSKTISKNIADIVLYGHIHQQYLDKLYNKTLINVGSVGNSLDLIRSSNFDSSTKETTNAHYVIIEGKYNEKNYGDDVNFQFVRTPYNIEKELEDVNDNLETDSYKYELLEGVYRNTALIDAIQQQRGVILRK